MGLIQRLLGTVKYLLLAFYNQHVFATNPLSIKTMRTHEKEFCLLALKSVQTSIKLTSFQKCVLQEMKCFQRQF